jgi:MATE family multidrug resistance protein
VAHLIWILVIYQFGDGMQYIYANALRGIACVKPMMYYAFIAYFCINLPVGYVLGFIAGWGIYGIWTAFPIGLTIAGILFYRRFVKELRVMAGR